MKMKKLFFMMSILLITILISLSVNASYWDGVQHRYTFDDSVRLIDQVGDLDSVSEYAVIKNVGGILGNSWNFSSLDDSIVTMDSFSASTMPTGNSDRSFNMWIKVNTLLNFGCFLSYGSSDVYWGNRLCVKSASNPYQPHFQFYGDDGSGTNAFTVNEWALYGITYDGTTLKHYLNGQPNGQYNPTHTIATKTSVFYFGADTAQDQHISAFIDETCIWNRTLTDAEMEAYYSNGVAVACDSEPTASNTIDIILTNSTDEYLSLTENTNFFVWGNYSYPNGSFIDTGNCSFSGYNMSAHFSNDGENFSLTSSGDIINLTLSESNTFIRDVYGFSVCRGSLTNELEILINNDVVKTLNGVIPLCTIGTHSELTNISTYVNESNINFTLKCSGCTPSINSFYKIVSVDNELLHYEREANNYNESMIFDSPYYKYISHPFHFFGGGGKIVMTCNDTESTEFFSASNVNLTINISSINEIIYSDGMEIEAIENNTIALEIAGDIISNIDFNLTFFNGTLIKNSNTEMLYFKNNETFNDGIYNISISATDDDGITIFKKGYFKTNDTTTGTFIWNFPDNFNTSIALEGDNGTLDNIAQDINLFAVECLVYNAFNKLYYNFTTIDIEQTSFKTNNIFNFNESGTWRVDCTQWDDHTDKDKEVKYKSEIIDNTIKFKVDKIKDYKKIYSNISLTYTGQYEIEEIKVKKLHDKYIFNYSFYLGTDKFKESITHNYRLECGNAYYKPVSGYISHFVCWDAVQYFDLENPLVLTYSALKCDAKPNCWDIEIIQIPSENVVYTSVGYLNEYRESKIIVVSAKPVKDGILEFDLTDSADVFLLFIIAFLYIGVNVIGFAFKNTGFLGLGFFLGVIIGLILGSISMVFAIGFLIASSWVFIQGARSK